MATTAFTEIDYSSGPFGRIQMDPAGAITFTADQPTVKDWIIRHYSLQKAILNLSVLIQAVADNKAQYITAKQGNLRAIANNVRDLFKLELTRHLNDGLPMSVARKKAEKVAEEYKKNMLISHEKKYPTDLKYEDLCKLLVIEKPSKSDK